MAGHQVNEEDNFSGAHGAIYEKRSSQIILALAREDYRQPGLS
jgi:hypothetical protein